MYILGISGHASDVADVAFAMGYRPVFVARTQAEATATGQLDVVVEDERLFGSDADFAMGIGDNAARAAAAVRLGAGVRFPALIHPDTSFGRSQRERVQQSRGTVVFAGARMTSRIAIGDFCTINLNATVSHDCELHDFVNLSPGATIAGNVVIERGAWIGAAAVVNQGRPHRKRVIGAGAVIGSGAVVTKDCDPHETYVGVPARKTS